MSGESGSAALQRTVVLDPGDNVAVALTELEAGESLQCGNQTLVIRQGIPAGHKVALAEIVIGGAVLKYGEVIGVASAPITRGTHVHVHNVMSSRLPGPGGR